jgi:O-antigen/teichoic acid export membrane protein
MLGVGEALVYRASREDRRSSPALSNSLVLAVLQSLLLGAIAWVVILVALRGKSPVVSEAEFYIWFIPLNLLTTYPLAFLQGRMAIRSFNFLRASVHVSYTAGLALLWAAHDIGVRSALAASLVANGITLGLIFVVLLRGRFLVLSLRAREFRSLLTLGLKLQVGTIAFVLAGKADIVALSLLTSTRVLGAYVVATAVGALPLLVSSAAGYVLYPLFSRQPRVQAGRAYARFLLFALPVAVFAAPAIVLISPLVVKVLFGSAFDAAVPTAQVLGLASVLRGHSVMAGAVLRGLGAPLRASGGDVVGLLVTASLLVPAIGLAQAEGAAAAVLLGAAAAFTWMTYHGLRVVGTTPMEVIRWWRIELGCIASDPTRGR